MINKIEKWFDKFEDKVRESLSHYPITYAFIGGIGLVLFWKGVWDIADKFVFMNGLTSLVISILILLPTGLFVSFFIGDNIIIAGLKRDKKLFEKAELGIKVEKTEIEDIHEVVRKIQKDLEEIKEKLQKK